MMEVMWFIAQAAGWALAGLFACYLVPYLISRGYHEGKIESWKSKLVNTEGDDDE